MRPTNTATESAQPRFGDSPAQRRRSSRAPAARRKDARPDVWARGAPAAYQVVRRERDTAVEQRRQALAATVDAVARAVEARDPYTAAHQRHVADLSVAIARELQLPEFQVEGIRLGAISHDVGKVMVPLELLSKPGRLSESEFQTIKAHPQAGYDIMKAVDFPWPVAQMILQHHERLDGSGYPNGLKGDDILLEARIIAVADVVEAMTTRRPYREALGIDAALKELQQGRGRFYDAAAVDACLRLFSEKKFAFSVVSAAG